MKNLNVSKMVLIAIIAIISWGCNEQLVVVEELSFNEVAIPNNLKADITNGRVSSLDINVEEIEVKVITDDGKEIIGKMRFTIPVGEENTLIKFEMTNNIFEKTALTHDFWMEYDNSTNSANGRVAGIGSCLKDCNTMDKGDGRGWCKAGCWAELALQAAMVAVAIAAL